MPTAARAELTPRLIDTLYTEALLLADEAHGYFDGPGRSERDALPPVERVTYSCESLRATTRLMQAIAWLLTRRAVAAGEISDAEGAAPARRLGAAAPSEAAATAALPDTARAIVAATADLYDRVRRLDATLGCDAAAAGSPVMGLMARLERAF